MAVSGEAGDGAARGHTPVGGGNGDGARSPAQGNGARGAAGPDVHAKVGVIVQIDRGGRNGGAEVSGEELGHGQGPVRGRSLSGPADRDRGGVRAAQGNGADGARGRARVNRNGAGVAARGVSGSDADAAGAAGDVSRVCKSSC